MPGEQRMSGESAMAIDSREQYFGGPAAGCSPSYRNSKSPILCAVNGSVCGVTNVLIEDINRFDAGKIRARAKSYTLE
jgi:hypothetical protein